MLVIADVGARAAAESELSNRVHGRVPEAQRVDAGISSFPFIGRLLVAGKVSQVRLAAVGVQVAGGLNLETIVVDAHDVGIDRDQLLRHRRVVLTGVGHGDITITVTGSALAKALGVPIQLAGATVNYVGHTIVVEFRGATLKLPMPKIPLVPCQPSATVTGDRVLLTCRFDRVPAEMVGLANTLSR